MGQVQVVLLSPAYLHPGDQHRFGWMHWTSKQRVCHPSSRTNGSVCSRS
jgi:hypothetical protein